MATVSLAYPVMYLALSAFVTVHEETMKTELPAIACALALAAPLFAQPPQTVQDEYARLRSARAGNGVVPHRLRRRR